MTRPEPTHENPVSQRSPGPIAGRSFAAQLRRARTERRLSLEALGDLIGCTKSYLSTIENGRRGPPGPELIDSLESVLGLTPGSLHAAAQWESTPSPVRARVEAIEEELAGRRALAQQLTDLVRDGGSLDAAYTSGKLERLIADMRGDLLGDQLGEHDAGPSLRPAQLPLEVPLINSVAAGYPREFTDLGFPARAAEEYVRVPDLDDPDAFAARVVGDSMSPEYLEGDVVVFSPVREIRDGDDCFARLEPDHETTFKRVYFEEDADGSQLIRLQPINSAYPPRTFERERVAGLYAAVSVTRSVRRPS